MTSAPVLEPARYTYSGGVTSPARWATWVPRKGDILLTTPPKCGTTWTQSILCMLVNGTTDLPKPVPVLSPWVDADLGVPIETVTADIAAQTGRRVLKTHTPADGFPIWDGVTYFAVYRHPLDLFFSLRKHVMNTSRVIEEDRHFLGPVTDALDRYLTGGVDRTDFAHDTLAKMMLHYRQTACSDRLRDLNLFHYDDMLRDGRGNVERMAHALGIDDARLIDAVTEATSFANMKANASNFTPVAGSGFWKSDEGFFDSATSGKWKGHLTDAELRRFDTRLAELVPDPASRAWLLHGSLAGRPPRG